MKLPNYPQFFFFFNFHPFRRKILLDDFKLPLFETLGGKLSILKLWN
jgi:hypothetical protein